MADEKQVSTTFTSMAAEGSDVEAPELGIGMLGYAFMGKAHTNAFKKIPYMMYPPVAIPRLVGIAGRNEAAVTAAAQRYGYENAYTDWRDMIANDDIQVFDNGGPNDAHAEPCNAAAAAGMHVFCEKPLARTAEEAKSMLDAVEAAGVKHMVAFNYRFVPGCAAGEEDRRKRGAGPDLSLARGLFAGMGHGPRDGIDLALPERHLRQRRAGRSRRPHH